MNRARILRQGAGGIFLLTFMAVFTFADYTYEDQPYVSQMASVSESEDAQEQEPSIEPPDDGEKEVAQAVLVGTVSHTEEWENNRNSFNVYCRDSGEEQWLRAPDVYWSGEKFCLSAVVSGKNQPSMIKVRIEDSPYETTLRRKRGIWEGALFDNSMINRWGRDGKESLQFVFSAVIDGNHCEDMQQVTVDDLHKYWLMHRKE